jgi:ribosomal protein L21E
MRKRIDREKLKRLERYEEDYKAVIKDYSFKPGDLVMIRNTAIEKSLDKKMKPRYNGPMIVVAQGKNGAYIVAEMTGAVLHQKIARFRVVPYFARTKIALPEGIMASIDADKSIIEKIDNLADDETVLDRDYLMDTVQLESSDNEEDEDDH